MEKWLQSVYSNGTEDFLIPFNPTLKQKITIYLRLFKENPVQKIFLRIAPEGEQILIPMIKDREDHLFVWYKAQTKMISFLLHYRFRLLTKNNVFWYNANGIASYTPLDCQDFRVLANMQIPLWLQESVFYQIFPDRFCNASPNINPTSNAYQYQGHSPVFLAWDQKPREYKQNGNLDFFGGDLAGIQSKIAYLKELGVNAVYLNPIFQAPSNHRYDTQDYFKIDPFLGSNEDFSNLVKALHKENIRIILDGVFNHSGVACRWFNKAKFYKEPGAYQNPHSPYACYYNFTKHPHHYDSWLGIDSLPKFNYRSNKLRRIIYKSKESIMSYWLSSPYEIDGWRLDVANMLGRNKEYQEYRQIYREMRQTVKKYYPNAYLLGEHFFDGSELLQGDALDATMNYHGFARPVREWLTNTTFEGESNLLSTADLNKQLLEALSAISWQTALCQYNLLDSHDLPRLHFLLEHPDLRKLAIVFLLTYVGVPGIYYGEEIGLRGEKSVESNRCSMPWNRDLWDQDLWQFYHKLIAFRKTCKALKKGGIKILWARGNIYSYARVLNNRIVVVILNRASSSENCELDVALVGVNSGEYISNWETKKALQIPQDKLLSMNVPPRSGTIWLKEL